MTAQPVDFMVFGADGQQGIIICRMLSEIKKYSVVACDYEFHGLNYMIGYLVQSGNVVLEPCDQTKSERVKELFAKYNPRVVINASSLETPEDFFQLCFDSGVDYVDLISCPFWYEELFDFDQKLKSKNMVAITGCGSVPGIGNVMAKKLINSFDNVYSGESGFAWSSNQKTFVTPFCLPDVIRELSCPVHILRNGEIKEVPTQSLSKTYNFPLIGEQTVYAVSHSEIYTYSLFFKDKGLQDFTFYAGFPEHSKVIIDALSRLLPLSSDDWFEVITSEGLKEASPHDVALSLGKEGSDFPDGYVESEILWTSFTGTCATTKNQTTKTMYCLVPPIKGWEHFGCNVDTGFPAAIIAQLTLEKKLPPGTTSPETSVPEQPFLNELENLGFSFRVVEKQTEVENASNK